MRTQARLRLGTVIGGFCAFAASPAFAAIIFVKADAGGGNNGTTWADAFVSLQNALTAAANGDEIWIAAGTYKPAGAGGNRAASFVIDKDIDVLGGFAGTETPDAAGRAMKNAIVNVVILSGDLNGDDAANFANNSENSRHVVRISNSGATLDGVTVRGGNADGAGNDGRGGGMLISAATPQLLSVTFDQNSAAGDGGGLAIDGGGPRLARCFFTGNRANRGGGAAISGASPTVLIRVEFVGNTAAGDGGGVASLGSAPTLVSVLFVGNTATAGAGAFFDQASANAAIANGVFNGNVAAENGGGIRAENGIQIANATITGNRVSGACPTCGGGGVSFELQPGATPPVVTNSILFGNSEAGGNGEAAQIDIDSAAPLMLPPVNFCDVQGLSSFVNGAGNISADPKFVDAAGPDMMPGTTDDVLYPDSDSPCVDAGSNALRAVDRADIDGDGSAVDLVDTDYDLNPRAVDVPAKADSGAGGTPVVDMGAFERQGDDCDNNKVLDATDITFGGDMNANGILDRCEEDGGDNENGNTNDNDGENANENTNDNTAGNTNDNTGGNENDNTDDDGGGADPMCAGPMCGPGVMPVLPMLLLGIAGLKWSVRRARR